MNIKINNYSKGYLDLTVSTNHATLTSSLYNADEARILAKELINAAEDILNSIDNDQCEKLEIES